jgi:hypothetical protein
MKRSTAKLLKMRHAHERLLAMRLRLRLGMMRGRANVDRLETPESTKASAAHVHCRSISGSAVASQQLSSHL